MGGGIIDSKRSQRESRRLEKCVIEEFERRNEKELCEKYLYNFVYGANRISDLRDLKEFLDEDGKKILKRYEQGKEWYEENVSNRKGESRDEIKFRSDVEDFEKFTEEDS